MLLSFSVANFKGFKEKTFLSLNEANLDSASQCRATYVGKPSLGYVSHVAGIFGANGAGKSSLIDALNYARHLVVGSATDRTHGDELYFMPHVFVSEFRHVPSEYEFQFRANGTVFRYGFSHNAERFWEEWLFETPIEMSKRQRKWFSRKYEPESDIYDWYINDEYILDGSRLKKGTRQNALFLSSAARDNSETLQEVFSWFKNKLHILRTNERVTSNSTASELLGKHSIEIKNLLKSAGIMFDDIVVKEDEISSENLSFPEEIPQELKKYFLSSIEGTKKYDTTFIYNTQSGDKAFLPLSEESDGTQALFSLAFPLIDVLQNSATLIVDELHNNLHPNLLQYIVSLFNNQSQKDGAAQLIFSSHDTSILSPIEISEDQIWFIEKDDFGQAKSFSLADYKGLRSFNYSKMYRDGRFGAVPEITRRI